MKHSPAKPALTVSTSEHGTLIRADASKVSGKEFFDAILGTAKREEDRAAAEALKDANGRGDNKAAVDLLLAGVARHIGMPLDELKQRTRRQWL